MTHKAFFLGLLLAVVAGASAAADNASAKATKPASAAMATNTQVLAYYFHGTIRCETCLKIERQAREAMERRFPLEMAEERLLFLPVNYDKPENAHFLKDYKLPCPSLVLVRQKGGKDEKWKLMEKTWELIETPIQFNEYIEGEADRLMKNQQ